MKELVLLFIAVVTVFFFIYSLGWYGFVLFGVMAFFIGAVSYFIAVGAPPAFITLLFAIALVAAVLLFFLNDGWYNASGKAFRVVEERIDAKAVRDLDEAIAKHERIHGKFRDNTNEPAEFIDNWETNPAAGNPKFGKPEKKNFWL